MEIAIKILNKSGLHARPAALFVQTAAKFKSDIQIGKDGKFVSGKSILGVISLGVRSGEEIMVKIAGADEQEAAKALQEIANQKFGEA
ncbi:phosphocarrier protein [Sporomusaceae bacterium BoRhaA]|jgi:phosphocarrier protein HPr|uniref:HPr family phosphocarrier protein n=1 Tax=Pelorhabdus rhamnosifermentans TaxID=2772457 RepID=UPI001C061E5E|nr:HPr family phosphocarrier protein [Pelorhabdus rhamnosifermentans]MBU2702397.1 phosphocarrier protein [Pelorhabdus rhamnosifermentans]